MRKILILVMSCNIPFFTEEERIVREESYGKSVLSGEYPDIDFWSYTASTDDKYHVDKEQHILQVPSDDTLYGTFEKTQKALSLLRTLGIEYDYILRTNCSTYVVCDLLRAFVDGIPDNDLRIFASCIYSTNTGSGPEPWDLYALGNAMLIPKFWCDIITDTNIDELKSKDRTPQQETEKSIYCVDDNAIGFIVNLYAEEHDMNKYAIWHSWHTNLSHTYNPEELIKSRDYMLYITNSIRIYGDNFSREEEFEVLKELEKNKLSVTVKDNEKYFTDTIKYCDYVHFVDWNTHNAHIFSKEIADKFLFNKAKYDFDLLNFVKELKKV